MPFGNYIVSSLVFKFVLMAYCCFWGNRTRYGAIFVCLYNFIISVVGLLFFVIFLNFAIQNDWCIP